jgi:hypothetical protein
MGDLLVIEFPKVKRLLVPVIVGVAVATTALAAKVEKPAWVEKCCAPRSTIPKRRPCVPHSRLLLLASALPPDLARCRGAR